jgi:hypothetical protein
MFPYHTLHDLVDQAICTKRKKISKSHMENLMQVIILLSHDISSNPVLLLVDDDPKKLQQVFFIKWYIQDGDIYRVIPYK